MVGAPVYHLLSDSDDDDDSDGDGYCENDGDAPNESGITPDEEDSTDED